VYVTATAGPAALSVHAAYGAAVAGVYLAAAAAAARRWDVTGFVAASCANMAAHNAYLVRSIGTAAGGRRPARSSGWAVTRGGVPGGRVLAVHAAADAAAAASERPDRSLVSSSAGAATSRCCGGGHRGRSCMPSLSVRAATSSASQWRKVGTLLPAAKRGW